VPEINLLQVDAYRNDDERDALLDWLLTAETFGKPDMWHRLFERRLHRRLPLDDPRGRSGMDGAER
jgi:hypothetical protein